MPTDPTDGGDKSANIFVLVNFVWFLLDLF